MSERNDRKIVNIFDDDFLPYDLEGPLQEDMGYIPLSYNKDGDANGAYAISMQPGAATIAHVHQGNEDYLIVRGELIESDGTVLKPGDFVHYEPGSEHNSRTETGCLLIGVDWGKKPN